MASDEELIRAVAGGDEQAMRELLRRYERSLSHFIHRYTGGRDVEDLYQDTWIRVLRAASRFESGKRFSTWLFQIAVNLCRDWHRRTPPEASDGADNLPGLIGLEHSEAMVDAARLLAHLPPPQREVLILRFFHDLTEDETAAILDCPKGTVKSRLHEGLKRLAAYVSEER